MMSSQNPTVHDRLASIPAAKRPRHIAVIMDGNGRWAQERGLPRIEGHRNGVAAVRRTVTACAQLGLDQLTLYCLSSENWKRPADELAALMQLLEQYMVEERGLILEQNIRLEIIGRREGLSQGALQEMDRTRELSATNSGLTLCLAINYGGRSEIADAARQIARDVAQGHLAPEAIDEHQFARYLYTRDMPDPDLLIRTAGEMRLSNYLLWQISYAEVWVTSTCWPDFDEETLAAAIADYAGRQRRFGGLLSGAIDGEDQPHGL